MRFSFSRRLRFPFPLALVAAVGVVVAAKSAHAAFELEKWTHSSGVEVYYYPVSEVPIVDVSVILDAGGVRDPLGKEGTASFAADMLAAGTKSLDENAFAEKLAFTGAIIGADVNRDKMVVSLRTLSDPQQREAATELFTDMIRNPAFPQSVLEREASTAISQLKQSLTEPDTVVMRNFRSELFGDHPYGRLVTEESLGAITREDIARHHQEGMVRSRMKFAFVGDIDREEANRFVSRITDGLPEGEPAESLADAAGPSAGSAKHVKHPSAQSHIIIGHLGLKREDPDYFQLLLGAEVLGGGMPSRLFDQVREKRGLAYSVYSYFNPTGSLGEFIMGAQTSNDTRDEALQVMRDVLDRFLDEGPDADELKRAKESWNKGFALRLDSNRKIMGYVEVIAFYDLPLDYPGYARDEISRISASDVREAFRRRILPDRLSQVVVGS